MSHCGTKERQNVFKPKTRQFDDGMETNLYDIAEQICSRPPQAPNTICLMMDHEIPDGTDFTTFEFELVSAFTMACIKVLYGHLSEDGSNLNPLSLSDDHLNLLRRYVNSTGYDINIIKEETKTNYQMKLKFSRYQKENPYKHLEKYMAK